MSRMTARNARAQKDFDEAYRRGNLNATADLVTALEAIITRAEHPARGPQHITRQDIVRIARSALAQYREQSEGGQLPPTQG